MFFSRLVTNQQRTYIKAKEKEWLSTKTSISNRLYSSVSSELLFILQNTPNTLNQAKGKYQPRRKECIAMKTTFPPHEDVASSSLRTHPCCH